MISQCIAELNVSFIIAAIATPKHQELTCYFYGGKLLNCFIYH